MEVTQEVGVCRGKTKLGSITVRETGPQPHLKVEEGFRFEVAVDHPSIVYMPVIEMTMWMQLHARGIIDLFAARHS